MFTRKSETQQFYAGIRSEATDTVAVAQSFTGAGFSAPAEAAPVPAAPAYYNGGSIADAAPAATLPTVRPAAAADESIIGPDLKITGNVISRGRVRLEGAIEGDMRCTSLIVSQSGAITGGIVAGDVAVYGRVAGTIKGQRVNLYASAHVEGDITHQGIGVEMGTHYDGRLRWSAHPLDDVEDAKTGVLPTDRRPH